MKQIVFSAAVAIGLCGFSGVARAQILAPNADRCTGYQLVNVNLALQRLNWAIYCHDHPVTPRVAEAYLRQENYNYHPGNGLQQTYPVYYDMGANSGPWSAPNGGTDCTVMPTSAINVGLCWSGCYTPETEIQFADGPVGIKIALDNKRVDLVTLSPDSALDDVRMEDNFVYNYMVDIEDAQQTIYNFRMKSGGTLRVTDQHPLLTADGVMNQAKKLTVGNELVRSDGSPDRIESIKIEDYFGKVYNLKPVTHDYSSNILVAQGYLSGSARYQNEYLNMINSVILRRALSDTFVDLVD